MRLSNRLIVAMVSLALFSVMLVMFLTYRRLVPIELSHFGEHVKQLASFPDMRIREARSDVLAVLGSEPVKGFVRAERAGGVDTLDGSTADQWRGRLEKNLVAELAANPNFLQFRMIGKANDGREVVRVERSGEGDAVRVVPDDELQSKGNRTYFNETVRLAERQVHISPIELNQEHGVIDSRRIPVVRVASPVYAESGEVFGILVINVDLRSALATLRSAAFRGESDVYLVSERREFLLHPDPSREYGLTLTGAGALEDELPELVDAFKRQEPVTLKLRNRAGIDIAVAFAPARIDNGPMIAVIETLPFSAIHSTADLVLRASYPAGLAAIGGAFLLAIVLARTITGPLAKMTSAVDAFSADRPVEAPVDAAGETGILARAFMRMSGEIREKTAALKEEVAERKFAEESLGRRSRELERSNAELEQFAYIASHDLQEPLRMVASYTELLGRRYRGKLDEKADKYIHYAVDGANRMQQLVDDLLAYSRVGTQGKPLQRIDSGAVARNVLRRLHSQIREANAEIVVSEMPCIDADELQFGQLLQNLVGNALKFRSERPVKIQIGAEKSEGRWLFSVTDNGIGIEKKYEDRIFQMFQRLHERGKFDGSGIGLAIVKKIVERHEGRVWFDSEPGAGASFHFTMPLCNDQKS